MVAQYRRNPLGLGLFGEFAQNPRAPIIPQDVQVGLHSTSMVRIDQEFLKNLYGGSNALLNHPYQIKQPAFLLAQ